MGEWKVGSDARITVETFETSARFTDCSCHSSPPLLALTFSHSVYPANENQACFLVLVVLDSRAGPAFLQFALLFPAAIAPQKIYPVSPSRWRRSASLGFCSVRRSCEKPGSSSAALLLPVLPKSL